MNESPQRESYDYFDLHLPERKIELLDGRLLVGNGLAGSRLLLDHILHGWELDAAVALGECEQWIAALCEAYRLPQPAGELDDALAALAVSSAPVEFTAPDLTAGAEGEDGEHHATRNHLNYTLWEAAESLGGGAFGRDIVMRLGEDGLTPDAFFYFGRKLNRMYEYYLDGPAEMVIEVLRPAHRDYDAQIKRERYARGGVPEYVLIDPAVREVEFLRLMNGDYVRQRLDADGLYRPASVPGLAIVPQHCWVEKGERFSLRGEHSPFVIEQAQPQRKRQRGEDNGLGWGELAFAPRLDLQPVRIRFDEFICWAPESKFEFWDGRIQICGEEGVRNLTGMLLMTLGLTEVCRFAAPVEWVKALQRRRAMEARDAATRIEWRARAVQAAEILRTKYHAEQVALAGDVLAPQPLGYWSRLQLAVPDLETKDWHHLYDDLKPFDVDVIETDRPHIARQIARGALLLEDL
jgi:Uma2 family endonuclease